jgi:hypothetical protein
MPGELVRRSYHVPASRRASPYEQAGTAIHAETGLQVTVTRAMAMAGQSAMFDVLDLANTRKDLELVNPLAAETLGLIANTVGMEIANSVRRFCFEIGG